MHLLNVDYVHEPTVWYSLWSWSILNRVEIVIPTNLTCYGSFTRVAFINIWTNSSDDVGNNRIGIITQNKKQSSLMQQLRIYSAINMNGVHLYWLSATNTIIFEWIILRALIPYRRPSEVAPSRVKLFERTISHHSSQLVCAHWEI